MNYLIASASSQTMCPPCPIVCNSPNFPSSPDYQPPPSVPKQSPPPPLFIAPDYQPPPSVPKQSPPPPLFIAPDYQPPPIQISPYRSLGMPQVNIGACSAQSSSLTSLFLTYTYDRTRIFFTVNGWYNDALPAVIRMNSMFSLTPTIPKYIYFAHPPSNPIPSSKTLANYYTGSVANTCDNFNFAFSGRGWNVDRVNLLSRVSLLNVRISMDLNYVTQYLVDSNGKLTYAFMTPNTLCSPNNLDTSCWCPVLQIQLSFLPVQSPNLLQPPSPSPPLFPVQSPNPPPPSPPPPLLPVQSPNPPPPSPPPPLLPVQSPNPPPPSPPPPLLPVQSPNPPPPSPPPPLLPVQSPNPPPPSPPPPLLPVQSPNPRPPSPPPPLSIIPSPTPTTSVPRVDLGSCPGVDQSSDLTSLYITYQTNPISNRMTFTINGWNNDALPPSIRTNPSFSITPTIPKYIYFAHPPYNQIPASKALANYYTGERANTCDNFNFNFGGAGWNVDRINLLSLSSLQNVQIFVNQDYVYNYLLDSNGMLTYAFMTPNSACGLANPNNNHCWCPVLQIRIN